MGESVCVCGWMGVCVRVCVCAHSIASARVFVRWQELGRCSFSRAAAQGPREGLHKK